MIAEEVTYNPVCPSEESFTPRAQANKHLPWVIKKNNQPRQEEQSVVSRKL